MSSLDHQIGLRRDQLGGFDEPFRYRARHKDRCGRVRLSHYRCVRPAGDLRRAELPERRIGPARFGAIGFPMGLEKSRMIGSNAGQIGWLESALSEQGIGRDPCSLNAAAQRIGYAR